MDYSGFELTDAKKLKELEEAAKIGGARGGPGLTPGPTALAPLKAKLYGAKPLFAWTDDDGAKEYLFVVRDARQAVVYRATVSGAQFSYPADAPRFAPGKTYSWTVESSPPVTGSSPSDPAEFVVVSGAEQEEIKQALEKIRSRDPYEAGLGRAKVFTRHRLWYDAIGVCTYLISSYPDRAELYEQRGIVYAQIEVTRPLADQDYAHADELLGAPPGGLEQGKKPKH